MSTKYEKYDFKNWNLTHEKAFYNYMYKTLLLLKSKEAAGNSCLAEKKLESCHVEKNPGQIEYFDGLNTFTFIIDDLT